MKKITIISLLSFAAGILIAAAIFVYSPGEKAQASIWDNPSDSLLSTNVYASTPQPDREIGDFAAIAEKLGPAVVGITAEKVQRSQRSRSYDDSPFDEFWDRFFGTPRGRDQEYRSTSAGTGFFISPDGYILTNNHIVENAIKVTITSHSDQEYQAKVIGLDPQTDLALLKVEAKDLPFAKLGDSDAIKVGQWVMAIGNPLGLTHTVTAGIVSAKGRLLPGLGDVLYQDFIQTDASINRGNSGGPLINMNGEVIGINSLIFAPSGGNIGIGFSISSNLAQKILTQLKEEGKVIRGYIGITCLPKIDTDVQKLLELKDRKGAVVNSVVDGLPADKAGLKRYDVIKSINGVPIEDRNDLFFKIAEIEPGTKTIFTIIRDGKEKELEVKPMARESEEEYEPTASSSGEIGISVQAMTSRIAQRYGYQTENGLVVTEVKRYSEAENKGLEVGDIILEANRKPTNTIDDLEKIVKKTKPGEAILLLVRKESRTRGGTYNDFIVTLRIPE